MNTVPAPPSSSNASSTSSSIRDSPNLLQNHNRNDPASPLAGTSTSGIDPRFKFSDGLDGAHRRHELDTEGPIKHPFFEDAAESQHSIHADKHQPRPLLNTRDWDSPGPFNNPRSNTKTNDATNALDTLLAHLSNLGQHILPSPIPIDPQRTQHLPPPQARHFSLPEGSARRQNSLVLHGLVDRPTLPIHVRIRGLPDGGIYSTRVETQIKMELELPAPIPAIEGPSASAPPIYSKWLRLNTGTAKKRRARIDAEQEATVGNTIYLSTHVFCDTAPNTKVLACEACILTEARRVMRQTTTRMSPLPSAPEPKPQDDESAVPKVVSELIKDEEVEVKDERRLVRFYCQDLLDFSSASVRFPLRIICYCSHHQEEVGFRIRFTMRDASGRVVGQGNSPPIMIMNDSAKRKRQQAPNSNLKAMEQGGDVVMDEAAADHAKKRRRHKASTPLSSRNPTTAGGLTSSRIGATSRQTSCPGKPPLFSPPSALAPAFTMVGQGGPMPPISPHLAPQSPELHTASTSAFNTTTPFAGMPSTMGTLDRRDLVDILGGAPGFDAFPPNAYAGNVMGVSEQGQVVGDLSSGLSLDSMCPPSSTIPSSTSTVLTSPTSPAINNNLIESPAQTDGVSDRLSVPIEPTSQVPSPAIRRLSPNNGSMLGGIEVTIVGANFLSGLQCVFGHAGSASTEFLGEKVLMCRLPPSPYPGLVPVWLENEQPETLLHYLGAITDGADGVQGSGGRVDTGTTQSFTYLDNAGCELTELALQVIGYRLTGNIEAPSEVARRIVGSRLNMHIGDAFEFSAGGDQSMSSSIPLGEDIAEHSQPTPRPGLNAGPPSLTTHLTNASGTHHLQSLVIELLFLMDVELDDHPSTVTVENTISQPNPTGQTLLHLAAVLGFCHLVNFLVDHRADIHARDKNGLTALHFAAMYGSLASARTLADRGADLDAVDIWERSPKQLARLHDQMDVETLLEEAENHQNSLSDVENDDGTGGAISDESTEDNRDDGDAVEDDNGEATEAGLHVESDSDGPRIRRPRFWPLRSTHSLRTSESLGPRASEASSIQNTIPPHTDPRVASVDFPPRDASRGIPQRLQQSQYQSMPNLGARGIDTLCLVPAPMEPRAEPRAHHAFVYAYIYRALRSLRHLVFNYTIRKVQPSVTRSMTQNENESTNPTSTIHPSGRPVAELSRGHMHSTVVTMVPNSPRAAPDIADPMHTRTSARQPSGVVAVVPGPLNPLGFASGHVSDDTTNSYSWIR